VKTNETKQPVVEARRKKFILVVIPTLENAYHRFMDFVARSIPIGLVSIAAVLEKEGLEVEIIDGDAEGLSFEETLRRTLATRPDYVGSTTMTATMDITERFYRALKKEIPEVRVIVGGPHVSALPQKTLEECGEIDLIVKGEGEETVIELLRALQSDQGLAGVRGICFREKDRIVETENRGRIENLGRLPLPAYHLLKYDRYRSYGWNKWVQGHRSPLGILFAGRGCFGKCNFCATKVVLGQKIRFFPVQRIKDEIDLLMDQYKIRVLYFQDDNFTANRRMVHEVCDYLIQKGYSERLEIMVSSRVDTVNPEILGKMRKAGVRWICFGVESGNQEILDGMGKKIKISQVKEAFRLARQAGLFIAGNYMIGHIGERIDTAMDTINLACELDEDYASFAIAIPFPGTELYQHCLEKGIPLPPWNDFGSVNSPPIPLNDRLDRDELMRLRRLATSRFFKRPVYLLKLLFRFRPLPVITDFLKMYFALRMEMRENRY
jgi:anaerobic magnesium-protoporphyrin IX monomethyl ester cyclase